ncbi:MAG: Ldh family oxidoreductase, partial [Flexibacteraceae bacterium]
MPQSYALKHHIMTETLVNALELQNFAESVFMKVGYSEADAKLIAGNLLSADLRGVDSHGVARLSGYLRLIKVGRINTNAKPNITHQTPSTAVLDADAALGLLVATEAMKIAIEKAQQVGTGWVSV